MALLIEKSFNDKLGAVLIRKSIATNVKTNTQRMVKVAVDPMASHTIATRGIVNEVMGVSPIKVSGVGPNPATVTCTGKIRLKIPYSKQKNQNPKSIDIEALIVDKIGEGNTGIDIVLGSSVAKYLGYISEDIFPANTPTHSLPVLQNLGPPPKRLSRSPAVIKAGRRKPQTLSRNLARGQLSPMQSAMMAIVTFMVMVDSVTGQSTAAMVMADDQCETLQHNAFNIRQRVGDNESAACKSTKKMLVLEDKNDRKSGPANETDNTTTRKEEAEGVVMISDAQIRRVMKTRTFPGPDETTFTIDDIGYGVLGDGYRTNDEKRRVQALVAEYPAKGVFSRHQLPKAARVKPISLVQKQGAKLPFVKTKPKSPIEKQFLKKVAAQLLAFDIIEPDEYPVTQCPITLADKDDGNDIRTCYMARPVNRAIQTPKAEYPNLVENVERAASTHFYKSQFDLHSAYYQVPVDKNSRHLLGVMLPGENGVYRHYRYKRLPFGLAASAALMVNWIEGCMAELPKEMRRRMALYIDDLVICSATFDEHLHDLREFFEVCVKHGITLKPPKAKLMVGSEVMFLGYKCGRGASTLTQHNVEAIDNIPPCGNKEDVRHSVGVFATARRYCRNFAALVQPLTKLLKKGVDFNWGEAQRQAFTAVKTELKKMVMLYKPQPDLPYVIHCDASDFAGGCWLAQRPARGDLNTVAFFSTTFNHKQLDWSAFQKEAYILLWSLSKCRNYIVASPHETTVYSDAHSLQYVDASTRSELSTRLLAKVADLRFKVLHIPGCDNTVADGLSRFRMAGIGRLHPKGKEEALRLLLNKLPTPTKNLTQFRVYMSGMNQAAYRIIQAWRNQRNAMDTKRPKDGECGGALNIVHVDVMHQVDMARLLLTQAQHACQLMCTDVISRIYMRDDGSIDRTLYAAVQKATKLCVISANQIWLVHGIATMQDAMVLTATANVGEKTDEKIEILDDLPGEWETGVLEPAAAGETLPLVRKLTKSIDTSNWTALTDPSEWSVGDQKKVVKDSKGHLYINRSGDMKRMVPKQFRETIIHLVHTATNHAGEQIVNATIRRAYHWPNLQKQISQQLNTCRHCKETKKRITDAHALYKSSNYCTPRQHFDLDVKQISVTNQPTKYLLVAVCKFSSFVVPMIIDKRTTTSVTKALDRHITMATGPAMTYRTDHAKEFVSAHFRSWCRRNGTFYQSPTPLYAQQHGGVERWWVTLHEAFRRLSNIKTWERDIIQIAFQHNTKLNRTTNTTPFDLWYGGPPNTHLANKMLFQADQNGDALSHKEVAEVLQTAAKLTREKAAANANAKRHDTATKSNAAVSRRIASEQINVGDYALAYRDLVGSSSRGKDGRQPIFKKPWIFTKVMAVTGQIYHLLDLKTERRISRHRAKIKKWNGTYQEWLRQAQNPDEGDEDGERPPLQKQLVTIVVDRDVQEGKKLSFRFGGKQYEANMPKDMVAGEKLQVEVIRDLGR